MWAQADSKGSRADGTLEAPLLVHPLPAGPGHLVKEGTLRFTLPRAGGNPRHRGFQNGLPLVRPARPLPTSSWPITSHTQASEPRPSWEKPGLGLPSPTPGPFSNGRSLHTIDTWVSLWQEARRNLVAPDTLLPPLAGRRLSPLHRPRTQGSQGHRGLFSQRRAQARCLF